MGNIARQILRSKTLFCNTLYELTELEGTDGVNNYWWLLSRKTVMILLSTKIAKPAEQMNLFEEQG